MITKIKSVCITIVLLILSVSISNARPVKAVAVSGGEQSSLIATEYGAVFSAGSVPGRPVYDYNFARVYAGEMNASSGLLENITGIGAGWEQSLAVDSNYFCGSFFI